MESMFVFEKLPIQAHSVITISVFFSMVLLVICDAHYCFSLVDVGEYGSNNDSGILNNSIIGKMFKNNKMKLPDPETIQGTYYELPFFLAGDEIFPLNNWLMRPSPLLTIKGKYLTIGCLGHAESLKIPLIFQTPINANPAKVEKYILATVALHNYLRKTDNPSYTRD